MPIQSFKPDTSSGDIIEALKKNGAIVVRGALNNQDMEMLDQEINPYLEGAKHCEGLFHGHATKRVSGLFTKSIICQKMALDPIVLDVMDHFLGPHCDRYQINCTQLISIGPGERGQILHADDPMFPFAHPENEIMVNVMWAADDFTKDNGATQVVPGSHLWERDRQPEEGEGLAAEMERGSYLIWLGSLRHGGGTNVTKDQWRRGIVLSYSLGWLKQCENMFLSTPPEEAKHLPEQLQRLIGYFVHRPNLGAVDGRDPIELLQDNKQDTSCKAFQDHMPDDIQELIEQHYQGCNVAVA